MKEGAHVLIVDDDDQVMEALVDALCDEGFSVGQAKDGLAALEALERGPLPCVILLDWMMPECDGGMFRKKQLGDPRIASVPVVLLTADERAERKTADLAAADFIRKPVTLEQLVAVIARYCPHGIRRG